MIFGLLFKKSACIFNGYEHRVEPRIWIRKYASTNLGCNIVEKAGWTLLHHVLDAHAHFDVLNQPPQELDKVLPFPYNGKTKCRVLMFLSYWSVLRIRIRDPVLFRPLDP